MFEKLIKERERKALVKAAETDLQVAAGRLDEPLVQKETLRLNQAPTFKENVTYVSEAVAGIARHNLGTAQDIDVMRCLAGNSAATDLQAFSADITRLAKGTKPSRVVYFRDHVLMPQEHVVGKLAKVVDDFKQHGFLVPLEMKEVTFDTIRERIDGISSQIEESGLQEAARAYQKAERAPPGAAGETAGETSTRITGSASSVAGRG